MINLSALTDDPRWLPHRLDPVKGEVVFLRLEREALTAPGFLADRQPQTPAEEVRLPLARFADMKPDSGPLHFIFHTAFCRSTLLVRALNIAGVSAGLSEPGIIGSLLSTGPSARPLIPAVLNLLSRPWSSGEAVIVKPTNHANALIPALLAARPDSKAVLMTNRLESFLTAVVRKGLMGRRWSRRLYLELQGYAPLDLGMDGRETFALTDLQVAGLAWFLNQRYFAALLRQYGERLRALDGDRFDGERMATFSALSRFWQLGLDDPGIAMVAEGPAFRSHAKLGGDFREADSRSRERSTSAVTEEEIAQTAEWIELIAQQAGLEVPLRQTL